MTRMEEEEVYNFLQGGGELGLLTRNYDWKSTPVGAPSEWPQSLRTTVNILLSSKFPMFLWWGDDLIQFYNDAYRPSLGKEGKHPKALGQKALDCWPEIWDIIYPLIRQVKSSGEATWSENQLIPIYRNGKLEDVYWTFGYSAVRNDSGKIEGVLVVCTETTPMVQTMKKLSESEKRFQTLIRDAPLGIIVLEGMDMTVKIVNEAYCRLINRNREIIFGNKLFDYIPEAKSHFRPILEKVLLTGQPVFLHAYPYFLHVNDSRQEGFLNVVYQPYKEDDGTVSGITAMVQDVTEQVLSRKKAEASEIRLRSLVENAPFPIGVYVGKEMKIEMANQAIIDVWGKGSDLIGKRYADVLPELNNQAIYDKLDQVYESGIPFHARNQRVDIVVDDRLQQYYFNYSFSPLFDSEGRVYGVMNTAAETTDLEIARQNVAQSEQNLRNMILQSPVAMCILIGPDHVIEVANKSMIELWGKDETQVMEKPVFEALPDARDQGLEQLLDQVFNSGETFSAIERPVELLRKNQLETVYQNFVYEPYRDGDGNILGILVVAIEVTEQVLARQKIEEIVAERTRELATANQNLQRSNAELAQFAYIASHDLQEPVRKVSTFAQMLESHLGEVDDRTGNYLNKIKKSTSRMLVLIRDVLAYSELSRINQSLSRVDLREVVQDICTDFELLIEQKQATINVGKLPVINAIPLHISQLFGNLISNALKFSRPYVKPVVSISSGPAGESDLQKFLSLNPETRYHRIVIKDNGIGFDSEHADKIFNIFQRLHGKLDYDGTGIGLALCQKIVQNNHGEIYATSEPGVGSSFVILLPA